MDNQTTKAGKAIYSLAVDAFIEGITTEILPAELFGLTEGEAQTIRQRQYATKIRLARAAKKERKAA